jgi:hypothetical protein
MPVDRALFEEALTESRAPNWRCPRCNGGHLRLVSESLHKAFSGDTKEASSHEAFDADWVVNRFTALVKCDNNACQETAAVAGRGRVVEVPNWEAQEIDYEDRFFPSYVNPSPPIIQIPSRCPDTIVDELKLAAVALWGDPTAAASHLRAAVELLLDAQKVPKTAKGKTGRVRLSLHDRIVQFEKARAVQGQALRAAKWLGNAGVHAQQIQRKGVFDMFDIIEKVLDDIYAPDGKNLAKLIAAVNKAKGPV